MEKRSFILVLIGFLCGCADTSSNNVKTSGFYASYSVVGNNSNSVTCTASFQVSQGGTYINLDSGDSVTCNGTNLSSTNTLGQIVYSGTVSYSPGSTYTITLNRTGEAPYNSTVVLPQPIANISPTNGTSIRKGTAFASTWTPSSTSTDYMNLTFSESPSSGTGSPCPSEMAENNGPPETGSSNWANNNTGVTGTCSVTLIYTRFGEGGTMASGLSGTISGRQQASVSVSLTD